MAALVSPLTIQTASIGIPDTLFLMLLALVVFGPRRLPEIGRQIGKLMYEFRKVSNDFKYQMEEELRASEEAERQKKLAAEAAARAAAAPPAPAVVTDVLALGSGHNPDSGLDPDLAGSAAETTSPSETASAPDSAPAVEGEVRGEPRKFPPDSIRIQPPSSGEVVAADRPFHTSAPAAAVNDDTALEHEAEAMGATAVEETTGGHQAQVDPPAEADPGLIDGTGREREAHHA